MADEIQSIVLSVVSDSVVNPPEVQELLDIEEVENSANNNPSGGASATLCANHNNLGANDSTDQLDGCDLDDCTELDQQGNLILSGTGDEKTAGEEELEYSNPPTVTMLPWGAKKEAVVYPLSIEIDTDVKSGEFVMRSLFAEFTIQAERKIEGVASEPLDKQLPKSLQKGEDVVFDQLLNAFGNLAEHCLPSLLRALFAWYDKQMSDCSHLSSMTSSTSSQPPPVELNKLLPLRVGADNKNRGDTVEKYEDYVQERRDLAVEFIFCLVLIEILKQLPVHPGHENLVGHIETLAFKRFKYKESSQNSPNSANIHIIADLYAEVIGVLAQARFQSVRRRFIAELSEQRAKELNPSVQQSIISLLMGMKFFRIKMVPIEEFEASFQFMHECAAYFLEVKDKDIKHALAGLFVEILVPVAATVKNEVNVPVLKNLVELLYSQTLDMSTKKKHSLALFPLVTCLLCVSQKQFFLQNWHYFLAMCLSHLKNRDPKLSRVALESLYRLLWVYMIRIKCESNTATQSRLQSIVNSLFPKGSKGVVPRDTPLNIFVKIIQFIAQERLDFAMKEIVFDLLSVGRPIKIIVTPERMSIGLRAFLVVADSLQQKEGEPPMPRTVGVLPSGSTLRVKKTFLNKMLTDDAAKSIGISGYYPYVRKAFDDILKALDAQFGRLLMMTNVQNVNKEPDDMITGERKPKIDLFRTAIAAIPRLMPDGTSRQDLVDMLSRLTVHYDEELRGLAFQSLQNLILDFADWREDVVYGFVQFILKEITDTFPQLLDNALRMLVQLLTSWKNALSSSTTIKKENTAISSSNRLGVYPHRHQRADPSALSGQPVSILHYVEGFALVMLCNCRLTARRPAVNVLKELKVLIKALGSGKDDCVIDVIDSACLTVTEKCIPLLPPSEKAALSLASINIDLQWLADRNSMAWTGGCQDISSSLASTNQTSASGDIASLSSKLIMGDAWYVFLSGIMTPQHVTGKCPSAVAHAWPVLHGRLTSLFTVIDPNPISENRASLLTRGPAVVKKPPNEREVHLKLWKNYVMFGCCVVPPNSVPTILRSGSPDLSLSSSPDSMLAMIDRGGNVLTASADNRSPVITSVSGGALYKLLVPLLRCESADIRDIVVRGMGFVNQEACRDLLEELLGFIKEAVDRKQENVRRRRRRDNVRLQLTKVLELIAEHGTFGISPGILDRDSAGLHPFLFEYIDGARMLLESEQDKDVPIVQEIKLHYCGFVRKIVYGFALETRSQLLSRDLRRNLFYLFSSWANKRGVTAGHTDRRLELDQCECTAFEFVALQAMSSVLCCGPMFDSHGLSEDGVLYGWIDSLLTSSDDKIYQLGRETVTYLLEFNPDISVLLDWVVDRCFTSELNQVADACFLALATLFSAREYPCDQYTSIMNVALMKTGCPRPGIGEVALQLLQVLDKRFFGSGTVTIGVDLENGGELEGMLRHKDCTLDVLLATTYSRSQMYLSKQLAQIHPELTMPMFSEITYRIQTARHPVRQNLLQYLLPWLYNMELVDPNIPPANALSQFITKMQEYYSNQPIDGSGVIGGISGSGSAASRLLTLRKEGWGSAEATEMVLNNLFFITAKFVNDHSKEVEDCWAALCACWPNNLRVIIRYLFIICGMAPNELLPYAKKIVVYLGRSKPERLIDEMMNELQTVESLNCLIERTETPPFFRVTSVRKVSNHSDTVNYGASVANLSSSGERGSVSNSVICGDSVSVIIDGIDGGAHSGRNNELGIEKGTIHTKRHSGEDPMMNKENGGTLKTNGASGKNGRGSDAMDLADDDNNGYGSSQLCNLLPHPLPMPEYGGYFAPLTEFLPDSSQSVTAFHRCNMAVMLLTDVVADGIDIDWSVHIPLMLHVIFLGLDNARALVADHCKKLLLNLLIVLCCTSDNLAVARVLLSHDTDQNRYGLINSCGSFVLRCNFTEPGFDIDAYATAQEVKPLAPTGDNSTNFLQIQTNVSALSPNSQKRQSFNTAVSAIQKSIILENGTDANEPERTVSPSGGNDKDKTTEDAGAEGVAAVNPQTLMSFYRTRDLVLSIIDFIAQSKTSCLWAYEDITAKLWSIRSADQLETFLRHVLRVFCEYQPQAHIEERWAQISLQLALSCSSRHYAGRSLQVFRALAVPVSTRQLSDILSRLVETAAEQGEDMQGYVTELMLTLESTVDSLDSDFRPIDLFRELFKSTPNLNPTGGMRRSAPGAMVSPGRGEVHARSTSYTVGVGGGAGKKIVSPTVQHRERRGHSASETDASLSHYSMRSYVATAGSASLTGNCNQLCRSRSAQSLKTMADQNSADDKMVILAQLFWIAVSMLESDYEHEFLLAIRLLEKILKRLPLDRPDCRDKLEKLQVQLKWTNFPGVHSLLLKGCTNPNTYDATLQILSKFTVLLDISVVDPTLSEGFPMNVISLLPFMLYHYEDPTPVCIQGAESIAQVSMEKSKKLENLATVMTLYSRRTFSKESCQWTRCVVKYLFDTYSHLSLNIVTFLIEVLEKGPLSLQPAIFNIIHCMLPYTDVNMGAQGQFVNGELLKTVAKHTEGPHWKEALKILKLAVTRSSVLAVPSSGFGFAVSGGSSADTTCSSLPSYAPASSFMDDAGLSGGKKELPGRTMEFSFDLSQTPVIGRKSNSVTFTPSTKSPALKRSVPISIDNPLVLGSGDSANKVSDSTAITVGAAIARLVAEEMQNVGGSAAGMSVSPKKNHGLASGQDNGGVIGGWKKPWYSQARTRECLVNLLTSCGQRVGLPKSPSVIFSQSSDLIERQSSMCSSMEEVSPGGLGGGGLSVGKDSIGGGLSDHGGSKAAGGAGAAGGASGCGDGHDTSASGSADNQFTIFKDFDFLEYELESQEGESLDNFNWGVRRRLLGSSNSYDLTCDYGEEGDNSLQLDNLSKGRASDGARGNLFSLSSSGGAPEAGRGVDYGIDKREESSDEEIGNVSPAYDLQNDLIFSPPGLPLLDLRCRQDSPSLSESSESICTDADLGELTPSNTSPNFALLPGRVSGGLHISDLSEREDAWRTHVACLLSRGDGDDRREGEELAIQTYKVFAKLFKEMLSKFVLFTQDCCHYLFRKDSYRAIAGQFLNTVEILGMGEQLCPLVAIDPDLITTCRLLDKHKFAILEIQEHLDTFKEKRDHTLECLDCIKSTLKLQALGESLSDLTMDDSYLDMCRCLYKLHFQLLLLFEGYCKLIALLTTAANCNASQINNLSKDVAVMRQELLKLGREGVADIECIDQLPANHSTEDGEGGGARCLTSGEVESALVEALNSKLWSKALRLLKNNRSLLVDESNSDENDVDLMLEIYCKSSCDRQTGNLIVTRTDQELSEFLSGKLIDVNVQLSVSVRNLERQMCIGSRRHYEGAVGGGRGRHCSTGMDGGAGMHSSGGTPRTQ